MTPGTKAALDDPAAALEGVALRTPGIAAPRAGRPAETRTNPAFCARARPPRDAPRRSPRAKLRDDPAPGAAIPCPGTTSSPRSPPHPRRLCPPPRRISKSRPLHEKDAGAGSGCRLRPTPPPRRSPQLVVRHTRENAASPRSPADAANDGPARTTSDPVAPRPRRRAPADAPRRKRSRARRGADRRADLRRPRASRPRPRVETVSADLGGVHASPTRRRRSARERSLPTRPCSRRAARRRGGRRREVAAAARRVRSRRVGVFARRVGINIVAAASPGARVRARDPSVSVGLLFSAEMELHAGPAHHLERPARHAAVVDKFRRAGLVKMCDLLAVREATDDELLTCHSSAHVDATARAFDPSPDAPSVQGEGDIYYRGHEPVREARRAARPSRRWRWRAGGALARDGASAGTPRDCGRATGFCFFNNAAVAARAALREPASARPGSGLGRAPRGGCQDILYAIRGSCTSPAPVRRGFYPGTGAEDEIGAGAGAGYNVNVPWREKGLSGLSTSPRSTSVDQSRRSSTSPRRHRRGVRRRRGRPAEACA